MRVGIPRALMYFEFYPLWRTFIEGLGLEVVPSHKTTKAILEAGIKLAADEACLPVKLALGHVADLAGRSDALFLPRTITIEENGFLCPKLVGFPDMVRALPLELPRLVAPEVDYDKHPDRFRPYLEAARQLGKSARLARSAFAEAERVQGKFQDCLRAGRPLKLAISDFERGAILTPDETRAAARSGQRSCPDDAARSGQRSCPDDAASGLKPAAPSGRRSGQVDAAETRAGDRLRIAIFGHPYNVHDPYLSLDIAERLEGLGCEVVSAEQVWSEECEQALAEYGKNVYWVFARRVLGPVMHFMKSNALGIDGLVYVVSFGCGPDALVKALVDLMAKQNPDLPYMAVVLDEHSGEGGLLTRLEAFVDMTRRMRKRLSLETPAPERKDEPREPERPEGVRAPEAREEYVSFPHAGTVWIPLRAVLEELDLPVIVPPQNTRRTLDIGSRHSPELACIPFKLTLGNYVEALEMGATHLLGLSSRFGASCRLYFFPAVQEAILRDMGYDFEIVTVDSGRRDSGGEITKLVKERVNKSIWEFAKAFFGTFWRKLVACEKVERLAAETRPYETRKGEASRIMRRSLARVDRCEPRLLRRLMRSVEDEFRAAVDEDWKREHEPLRIGVLGELFVLIDQFANLEIERKLGEMGVLVKRNFWVSLKILRSVWRWLDPEYAHAMNAAAKYLGVDVGAECNVTVGDTVVYKKHGFDGIVHVMPFTCMPEIVAESILPRVKGDTGMPVITFALDEQTSHAGMQTRLEAFVDLLTRQRRHAGKV